MPPKGDQVTNRQKANLVPYTSDTAREAGRKSGEARRRKREAQTVTELATIKDTTRHLSELANSLERDTLGPAAEATAAQLIARISSGAIEVDSRNVADLLKVLVDVARLERGEATSHVLTGSVDALARLEALRQPGQVGARVADVVEGP